MKRKTNLFYAKKKDDEHFDFGEFITFSNYGEGLTKAFAATDKKLFPSMFLCFDIDFTDNNEEEYDSKEKFIRDIIINYENKLAIARDSNINVLPLNWLLDWLKTIGANLVYIGEIAEEDYNGTYTDLICCINNNCKQDININPSESSESAEQPNADGGYLHGWGNELPEPYKFKKEDFPTYNFTSNISSITWSNDTTSKLKFNIIVPLFNVVDCKVGDKRISKDIEEEIIGEDNLYKLDLSDRKGGLEYKWVPLGIWFAKKPVELEYENGFGAAWSLALGTQFKPFPYSNDYNIYDIDNHENNVESFATFTEVLYKQKLILEKLDEYTRDITKIIPRMEKIEHDIDELKKRIEAL